MLSTISTPIIGLLRKPASALFLSVFGLPVSGSLASLSATMVPHRAGPQAATRTVALPSSVRQVPSGSAASPAPSDTPSRAAAIVAVRRNFIGSPFFGPCGRGRERGAQHNPIPPAQAAFGTGLGTRR